MRKLDIAEIVSCAKGIRGVEEIDGAISFIKFDQKEHKAYRDAGLAEDVRSRCPAGVVLDFYTDSETLKLSLTSGKFAREWLFIDVYVDGIFYSSQGTETPEDRMDLGFSFPQKKQKHVEVYLPQCRMMQLNCLELQEGSYFSPAEKRKKYLAIGDSITQGMSGLHPSMSYAMKAARLLEYDLHNLGVGGHIYDVNTLHETPVDDVDFVTVAYGINDFNRNRSVVNAKPYLVQLRTLYPKQSICVLSPIFCSAVADDKVNENGVTLNGYRNGLKEIVGGMPGVNFIESEYLFPPCPGLLADGCHPNDAGHAIYGMNLAKIIGSLNG